MIRVTRLILGFLIAPVAAATVIPAWWAVHIWPTYGSDLAVRAFVGYCGWALIYGYSAAIFVGLPLYIFLRKVRWCNLIVFLLASYFVGMAWPVVIFVKYGLPLPNAAPILDYVIWWGGSGAVGGLILWLIDRPDLRVPTAGRSTN